MEDISVNNEELSVNNEELSEQEIIRLMNMDYIYPTPVDDNFQYKIYKKREFYYNKIFDRPDDNVNIKEYMARKCNEQFETQEHQQFIATYINTQSPYTGVLLFHGTGTGKTISAISIAENFKNNVNKYGTKIYVIVPGPIIKDSWKRDIIKATGNTYVNKYLLATCTDNKLLQSEINNGLHIILQYYKFMSYKSFHKRVLGEKIIEKKMVDNKLKTFFRKTKNGEYERESQIDKIYNLNNTLLIIDEAHNFTGNEYGESLKKIINDSTNLRIVLLTATPMKNRADDIIELINFLRPCDDLIKRDKLFVPIDQINENDTMIKEDGIAYFKKMISGYVSSLRGYNPLTFANRNDVGIITNNMEFTKIIPCEMHDFQHNHYTDVLSTANDALDRVSESICNFVFPGMNEDKNDIIGYHGNAGFKSVYNQVDTNIKIINTLLHKKFNIPNNNNDIIQTSKDKMLSGKFMHIDYLHLFSIKFSTCLKNLDKLVYGNSGVRTAFVYSNFVITGIKTFCEILLQNGYINYEQYITNGEVYDNTKCYYCGTENSKHNNISDHLFKPATFIAIIGKTNEDEGEYVQDSKFKIIQDIFNSRHNYDGKYIKFILGSGIVKEGASFLNVGEVHIIDVYYNLNKIDQIVGRTIRHCSHNDIVQRTGERYSVNEYKYCIIIDGEISSEENLYIKAEKKHYDVKKIERAMRESAIDCPLNMNSNIVNIEYEKYKHCGEKGQPKCPAICDYTKCHYKCDCEQLNNKYYNDTTHNYDNVNKKAIDYSTFNFITAENEINYVIRKISELYKINIMYSLKEIMEYVFKSLNVVKRELFNKEFIYIALDRLMPLTKNDFNNFRYTLYDKYNRPGHLIYVYTYYVFQSFDYDAHTPIHYRNYKKYNLNIPIKLSNYINTIYKVHKTNANKNGDDGNSKSNINKFKSIAIEYDFASTNKYYDSRKENNYVGIIDKYISRNKSNIFENTFDMFKIRISRGRILDKKRAIGLPSYKGADCITAKNKQMLKSICENIGLNIDISQSRKHICNQIRDKLLYFEKYSTGKDKKTYVIIPANHPKYTFPYNLEDRVPFIIHDLKNKFGAFTYDTNKQYDKTDKHKFIIVVTFDNQSSFEQQYIEDTYDGILSKNIWTITMT